MLFGAIHGNFSQFFYTLFVGIVFGWIYVYSGKLRYSIILHMLFNTIGVIISEAVRLAGGTEAVTAAGENGPWWLSLFLAGESGLYLLSYIGTIPAGVLLIRKLRPQKPAVDLTKKQKWFLLLLNPSIWVLIVFLVILSA